MIENFAYRIDRPRAAKSMGPPDFRYTRRTGPICKRAAVTARSKSLRDHLPFEKYYQENSTHSM